MTLQKKLETTIEEAERLRRAIHLAKSADECVQLCNVYDTYVVTDLLPALQEACRDLDGRVLERLAKLVLKMQHNTPSDQFLAAHALVNLATERKALP